MQFEAIIFDFGGVILNLDEQKTYRELAHILQCEISDLMPRINRNNMFYDFECGRISSTDFIASILEIAPKNTSVSQIIHAWNAMLLDFPIEHASLLIQLKQKFRTFLLSNTNELHEQAFISDMKQNNIPNMNELFEIPWYSHTLGLRKPNHDIFEHVISIAHLNPSKTVFLDDRIDNITAAKECGLQTIHITKENNIIQIFKDYIA